MKPSSNFLFGRCIVSLCSVICFAVSSQAVEINWIGGNNGSWGDAVNWAGGVIPTSGDVASFSSPTGITIELKGHREVLGLATPSTGDSPNLTNVHNIQAGTVDSTLTIGEAGISHLRGGLTIGSNTANQRVDIVLSATQTWDSSRSAGSGNAQAIFIQNNVRLKSGLGAQTLTLTGFNTGSYVNGTISAETGSSLSIVKNGSGTWLLNGALSGSSITALQVDQGILRLGNAAVALPEISVATGATLSFRAFDGTNGFTGAQIANYVSNASMASGALFSLDTSNASSPNVSIYDGAYTSSVPLSKTGHNNLLLTGSINTPGGFTVNGGGVVLASGSSLGGNTIVNGGSSLLVESSAAINGTITISSTGAIVARAGGIGLNEAQITALRTNASVSLANTAYFGISTFHGDFTYSSVLPNTATTRFTKAEANTLFLTAQNVYEGGTQITGGILSVSDIKNGGQISQIGRSGNVPNGIILAGGRLQYTGTGATTDRLFNLTASSAIESSGTGALIFGNSGTIGAEGGSRSLNLTGYNQDDNRLGLNLANVTGTFDVTSVIKNGFGKWILSGNNTHTGNTTVRGGTLVLDYTGGKTPISTTGRVVAQNGTVHFMGSGEQTIGSLNLSENDNGFGIAKITGGMNLTATTLLAVSGSQRMVLIDLFGDGNSLSYGSLGTGITNSSSGRLIMTPGNRSNIVVRANDGTYGFASAAPSDPATPTGAGSVQKLEGQTSVAPGTFSNVNSDTTNYRFGAGSYTSGASLKFQTITFDSTDGNIDVNFGSGHTFNSAGNGRGLLFTGGNDVNFSGTDNGGSISQSSIWFHNYLDDSAQLNISSPLTGGFLSVGGSGFTNYTGKGLASGDFVLNGGLFRVGNTQNLNTGTFRINEAVFEIGANLTNGGALDLVRTTANFTLRGDSGFSAYGADRTVSLGTDVTWGASNFLVSTAGEDGDHAFRLSSTRSNATIDFKSNINLNGKMRTVDVANGSAGIDARLSGNLTGSGIASRFAKTGLGTLELTGTNTYSGMTRVEAGKLRVGGGGLTATTSIHVQNSTLELASGNVINDAADITLENATFNTASAPETLGRLTLIGDNKLDLVGLGNIIKMADSSSLVWSSSLSIYNWNGNAGGGGVDQFFIGTTNSGVTTDQLSKIFFVDPTVDGISYAGTFNSSILGNGEIVALIPEPSAAALALLASVSLMIRRKRER
jgi:fibronectin-binding autotransporter adhesin